MSFTDKGQKREHIIHESSESEENYFTHEERISEESLSNSIAKLKNIIIAKNRKNSKVKKQIVQNRSYRFSVSLRFKKSNRHFRPKNVSQKMTKRKNTEKPLFRGDFSGKPTENLKKGKRCYSKGKAKVKPPGEEYYGNIDKHDSDDESDNGYFGRISLGYFQKFRDESGASTSYQWDEDLKNPFSLRNNEEKWNEISEDKEFLELQRWGMTALDSSFSQENTKLNRTDNQHSNIL